MGLDIFLQAFERGDAARRDGADVRRLLLARSAREPDSGFARLIAGTGEADVYGIPDEGEALTGLMFTHVSGNAFDTIVEVARAGDLVVMPVGCRVCVVRDSQRSHLPKDLTDEPVELVETGEQLVAVIEMP